MFDGLLYLAWQVSGMLAGVLLHKNRSTELPIVGYWYSVFYRRSRDGVVQQRATSFMFRVSRSIIMPSSFVVNITTLDYRAYSSDSSSSLGLGTTTMRNERIRAVFKYAFTMTERYSLENGLGGTSKKQ